MQTYVLYIMDTHVTVYPFYTFAQKSWSETQVTATWGGARIALPLVRFLQVHFKITWNQAWQSCGGWVYPWVMSAHVMSSPLGKLSLDERPGYKKNLNFHQITREDRTTFIVNYKIIK